MLILGLVQLEYDLLQFPGNTEKYRATLADHELQGQETIERNQNANPPHQAKVPSRLIEEKDRPQNARHFSSICAVLPSLHVGFPHTLSVVS